MATTSGIIVASFGTSYPRAEAASIKPCEDEIAAAFPSFDIHRAWTSSFVRAKLEKRDSRHIDSVPEALSAMADAGVRRLCVQPLHLLPGAEYHEKILAAVSRVRGAFDRIVVGRPVFDSEQDYREVAAAVQSQLRIREQYDAVVLMGHGSRHPSQSVYGHLQTLLHDLGIPAHVGTIEAYPRLSDLIPRLRRAGVKRVGLQPLLLVAGDHVTNDMASDDEESWKSVLTREGFAVVVEPASLGENPRFREIYVRHAKEAIVDWDGM